MMRFALLGVMGVSLVTGCRALTQLDGLTFDGGGGAAPDDCVSRGLVCSDAPPSGWHGPGMIVDDASGDTSCPAAFPSVVARGGEGVSIAMASCDACTCGPPPGDGCATGSFKIFDTKPCNGSSQSYTPVSGQCTPVSAGLYVKVSPPGAPSGSCAPAGGAAHIPAPAWASRLLGCGVDPTSGGGCAGGLVCAPPPANGAPACIWKAGDASCPAAFPEKHAIASVTDTRYCTSCTCGSPPGCVETATLFTDGACGAGPTDVPTDGTCAGATGAGSVLVTTTPASGGCAAKGGLVAGDAKPAVEATFCCAP